MLPVAPVATVTDLYLEMNTDYPLLNKYVREPVFLYLKDKTGIASEAELKIRIEECLKFLSLIQLCRGDIPVSSEIDDIWHLLILETWEYQDLCQKLPGGRLIHHQSKVLRRHERNHDGNYEGNDEGKVGNEGDTPSRRLSWLVSYYANFGEFTPQTLAYWPIASELLAEIERNSGESSGFESVTQVLPEAPHKFNS